MNTPPYNIKAAYEAQRDGVAEVNDGEQIADLEKSNLPRTKLANEAMNLARSMHEFDPGVVNKTPRESHSPALRPSTLEHPAYEEAKPMLPSEFLLGIGRRIETLRLIRMDSTNDKNEKGISGGLGRAA